MRSLDLRKKIVGGEIARPDKNMTKRTRTEMADYTKKRRRMAQESQAQIYLDQNSISSSC
eukprot:8803029-Heterocapsa_arctica.AAC.1